MWEDVSISTAGSGRVFSLFVINFPAWDPGAGVQKSLTLTFPSSLPERTKAEPGKCQREANCNRDPAGSRLSVSVLHVLTDSLNAAEGRHRQEHGASNLQPQLVRRAPERSCGGADAAHHRIEGTAASRVLAN